MPQWPKALIARMLPSHAEPVPIKFGSVSWRYRVPLAGRGWQQMRRWWMVPGGPDQSELPVGVRDERLRRVEAVLFLAREPLTVRKLSLYANLADGTEARTLARRLNELYDSQGRAFRIEEVAGGMQLLTRAQFAAWLKRLSGVPGEFRLSAPSLETLAVVAYRQPVLRAEVEAIRGVGCGEVLRQLIERDLVRIGGRSEELGRPYLYSTTKRFLQIFGLQSLEELPRKEILQAQLAPALANYPPDGKESESSSSTQNGNREN